MNLDAVRTALLADAQEEADALLAQADADGQRQLASAIEQSAALIQTAHADGLREAEERLARRRAAARREARQIVLAAQRRVLDELNEQARAAALAIASDDGFAELADRLRAIAAAQLDGSARVSVDPGGEPGVVADDGHRRVDYRLVTLAQRAVDEHAGEAAQLWT